MTTADLQLRYPDAETFRFGDGPELCAQLLRLVRSGKKRATCSSLATLEAPPVIGRCDIALTWDGTPAVVIRTLELVTCTFETLTEEMALMEGENDDLAGWRRDHEAFFRRAGVFAPDMPVLWERFEMVEDLASEQM
ncbi:ASCH domain-containing protein [Nereida sp. MMG025]|uniref:ASCH domain-containing protein n=1 Tax=Nereida sp. MMG025 TaxID=2909981 RepID=UPI001F472951|nr:ASCH domain-containing protein [Nereida sp. MMG025]MCF6444178.1 ASCH domain-containing protein [Nereida sp. MMG025]